jgi:hypothetical protein
MILVDIIAGAQPNFMKVAPIINAIKKSQRNVGNLSFRLVHTGQHYDPKLSGSFFEQLNIPQPDINLVLDNFRRLDGYGFKGFKKMKVSSQDKGHDEQFKRFPNSLKIGGPSIISFDEIVNSTKSTIAVLDSLEKGGIPVKV